MNWTAKSAVSSVRRFAYRLLTFLRRNGAERELAREIGAHITMLEDEYRRRGMSPDDARLAARRALGGVEQAKARHRDARSFVWLDDARQDLQHAVKGLGRAPGFAAVAVVTLALGIGVNNAFFTLVNAICLHGLPIEEPERVLFLGTRDAQDRPGGFSYAEFEELRVMPRSFTRVAAFSVTVSTIAADEHPAARVFGAYMSASGFDLLGDRPVLGRGFLAEDDRPGAPAVVILGGGVWKARYAGATSIVGRSVAVNGAPATVIGVMPEGFRFPGTADVWQPLAMMPGVTETRRDARRLSVIGRLADRVTPSQARGELATIASSWSTRLPESYRGVRTTAIPINQQFNGQVTDRAWLAFITAGVLVALIACANVANLLLMRAASRSREIAIRTSIGATRGRVVRQLLIESLLLAGLAAVAGALVSVVGLRLLSQMVPPDTLPYWMAFTMDARVFTVLTAVSVGSVFVFGLAPALQLAKTRPAQSLIEGGRSATAGIPARRWMAAFLAVEFGLTVVLLANVVGGIRQQHAADRGEFAVDAAPLLTMWLTLPNQPYDTREKRSVFFDRLQESFGAVPGVRAVAMASALPHGGGASEPLDIAGRTPAAGPPPTVMVVSVGERYFETLDVPVRGRVLTARDGQAGTDSAIVNERFVEVFFGKDEALGRLIRVGPAATAAAAPWVRIVGVAPTIRQRIDGIGGEPVVFLPRRPAPAPTAAIVVRADTDPVALTAALRREVQRLDRSLPLYRVMTLDRAMQDAQWNRRLSKALITSIGSIALIMALVGLYAVTAYGVQRWTPELGIRIAFGAQPRQVGWLVMRRALTYLGVGLALGIACTYAFDRAFGDGASPSSATNVGLMDPGPFAALLALIVAVAVAACLVPTRRAVRLNPTEALRYE